jgi:hypothetical protein
MPQAKDLLSNFLTDTIRAAVRREVLGPDRDRGKLYGQPRVFNDLLSSQPLCFNLFGELQADRTLATRVLQTMTKGRIGTVTRIEFEYSPGRGDPRFTGDRSALDVYVEHERDNRRGFLGIEVKYHEGLGDVPAPHRLRYDEIARNMEAFHEDRFEQLGNKPLQQIWRDHLLAASLLLDQASDFDDGVFVFLYPKDNDRCADAVANYRKHLVDDSSFTEWTLENVVSTVKDCGAGKWIDQFSDRYLDFAKLERVAM